MENIELAVAACVILAKKRRPVRFWVRSSFKARSKYSGIDLDDLERDGTEPVSGELRCDGSINNSWRIRNCDFQNFLTLIGHKIVKLDTN